MQKEEVVILDGEVIEALPNATFRIQLDNKRTLIAYTCGKMRKNRIKVLIGDKVKVEVNIVDLTKGRIIKREK